MLVLVWAWGSALKHMMMVVPLCLGGNSHKCFSNVLVNSTCMTAGGRASRDGFLFHLQ